MIKSALKARWVLLAAALVSVLSACGVLVDNTPPSVSVEVVTTDEGLVARARASDQESGIKYLSVHARVGDSLQLLGERRFGGDGSVLPEPDAPDVIPPDGDAGEVLAMNSSSADDSAVQRSETLDVPLEAGQHTLVVRAVNGSNLTGEIEQVVGEVVEPAPVSVQSLPVLPRMENNVVLREEFRVPFISEGSDLVNAQLRVKVNDGPAFLVDEVELESTGGRSEFTIDGAQFLVGDELAFTVTVFGESGGSDSADYPVLTVVTIDPGVEPAPELRVELFSVPSSVIHGETVEVRYGIQGGASLTAVEFLVSVNGGAATPQEFGSLGDTPLQASFILDSGLFTAGDSLRVIVAVEDEAGQEVEQSAMVEVVAPESPVVDPLEVGVTRVSQLDNGELFSDVDEFVIHYYARSGAVITVMDLMVLNPGATDFRVLDTLSVENTSTMGLFTVDAASHQAGETYEYRIRAVDAEGRTEVTDSVVVEVTERVVPAPDEPEVTLVSATPSEGGSVFREELALKYIASSGAPIDQVDLRVSVNGESFRLLERSNAVHEAFTVNGRQFAVGDEVSFQVSVRDELGRVVESTALTVTVIEEPPVAYDPVEVSAWLAGPTPDASTGLVPFGPIEIGYVGSSGAELRQVEAWVSRNGGTEDRVSLEETGSLSVNGSFTLASGFQAGDELVFRVRLLDTAGQAEWSSEVTVLIAPVEPEPVDDIPPVVENVVVRVESEPSGTLVGPDGIEVDYVVTDDVALAGVRLYESIDGGTPKVMMNGWNALDGEFHAEGTFTVSTDHYVPGQVVEFQVEAVDLAGNTSRSEPYSFEVAEFVSTPPFQMNSLPDEVEPGQVVNVLVYQDEDSTSGRVSSVRLFINGDEINMAEVGPNWHHQWDTTGETEGFHVIAVLVKYNFGTPVLLIHDVVVKEPDEDDGL